MASVYDVATILRADRERRRTYVTDDARPSCGARSHELRLLADGLVDVHIDLTPRGMRALSLYA
ncbi:MAG TPA: hypothetical protein VF232_04940 [Gaiellaceae bacterium]